MKYTLCECFILIVQSADAEISISLLHGVVFSRRMELYLSPKPHPSTGSTMDGAPFRPTGWRGMMYKFKMKTTKARAAKHFPFAKYNNVGILH